MLTQKEAQTIAHAAVWKRTDQPNPYFILEANTYELPWGWIFDPTRQENIDSGLRDLGINPIMVDKFTKEVVYMNLTFDNGFSGATILKEYAAKQNYEWRDEIYIEEQFYIAPDWAGQIVHQSVVLETPLDYKAAYNIVQKITDSACIPENSAMIFEDLTISLPWGWLFFYDTINPTDEKPWDANTPIMVDKHNSMCYALSMWRTSGSEVLKYAQDNGYDYDPAFWTDEYEMRCIEILEFWES
jgi:hypothetical protein